MLYPRRLFGGWKGRKKTFSFWGMGGVIFSMAVAKKISFQDLLEAFPYIDDWHAVKFKECLNWDITRWLEIIPFLSHKFSRFTRDIYQGILRKLIRFSVIEGKGDYDYDFAVVDLWSNAVLPVYEKVTIDRLVGIYADRDRSIHPQDWRLRNHQVEHSLQLCVYCAVGYPCFLEGVNGQCCYKKGKTCHHLAGLHFCAFHGNPVLTVKDSRFGVYDFFVLRDGRTCKNLAVMNALSSRGKVVAAARPRPWIDTSFTVVEEEEDIDDA